MSDFQFALGSTARLALSNETGVIIARAKYLLSEDCYLVRYKAADGRQVEGWWNNSAIAKASE